MKSGWPLLVALPVVALMEKQVLLILLHTVRKDDKRKSFYSKKGQKSRAGTARGCLPACFCEFLWTQNCARPTHVLL